MIARVMVDVAVEWMRAQAWLGRPRCGTTAGARLRARRAELLAGACACLARPAYQWCHRRDISIPTSPSADFPSDQPCRPFSAPNNRILNTPVAQRSIFCQQPVSSCRSRICRSSLSAIMATTLANAFSAQSQSTAVIVPGKPALSVSYQQLSAEVASFQKKLAALGIAPASAVSIALPNSYEFIVSFLAASWQRAIAAPLNPAYKQSEFEFYIDDLSSAVALVPKGQFAQDSPAVRAARKYQAAIAECYWNGKEVVLDVKDNGKLKGKGSQRVEQAQPEDVALVLHTSGTTGRPKAVPLTHRNLTRTMSMHPHSTV